MFQISTNIAIRVHIAPRVGAPGGPSETRWKTIAQTNGKLLRIYCVWQVFGVRECRVTWNLEWLKMVEFCKSFIQKFWVIKWFWEGVETSHKIKKKKKKKYGFGCEEWSEGIAFCFGTSADSLSLNEILARILCRYVVEYPRAISLLKNKSTVL